MDTGSKSSRITPADGLAFLTSAINLMRPGAASGVKKLRTAGASRQLGPQRRFRRRRLASLDLGTRRRYDFVENCRHPRSSLGNAGDPTAAIAAVHRYDHLNDAAEKRYRWQREPAMAVPAPDSHFAVGLLPVLSRRDVL